MKSSLLSVMAARCAVLISLFFGCLFATAPAQQAATGSIEGRVSNSAAGNYLKQVRVIVESTAFETFTDEAGEYRLEGVPAGAVTVRVSAAGLGQQTARVSVVPGEVARRDFDFGGRDAASASSTAASGEQTIVLGTFTVAERELSAQAAALQEQRTAPNIKNVVAFEEFGDLGDGNPGEFLKFVPGMQIAMSPAVPNEVSIRGMPGDGTLLTVDGVELSSDNPATRAAGFTASNVANIDRIEITKVPTPDSPANAVGGTVNVVSKSGFSRRDPQFNYSVFGTLTTKEPLKNLGRELFRSGSADDSTGGPHFKPGFDFTYIKPVNRSLALSLSGGHNIRWEDKDNIQPTWNRVILIQTQSQEAAQISTRERNVASFRADWRPLPGHSIFANFSFTNDDVSSRIYTQTQAYGAGATGGQNFTQGAAAGVGTVTLGTTYREQLKNTGSASLGHTWISRNWRVETRLSRSESRRKTLSAGNGYDYFGTTSATFNNLILRGEGFDGITEGVPPLVAGTNRAGQPVDINNGRLFTLNSATSPEEPLMKNAVTTAKINASREFGFRGFNARIMAGLDFSRNERDLRAETRTWNFRPTFAAATPERLVGSYDLINEPYSNQRVFTNGQRVQWIDPRKVYQLYLAQPSWFVLNESAHHISKVNGSRKLEEKITAGYLRTDWKLLENRLWIVAGARYERTDNEGLGPLNDVRATFQQDANGNLIRNAAGQPIKVPGDALTLARLQYSERASYAKKHYGDFYPSVNTSYAFAESFIARAAYARTIGRPGLEFIIPTLTIADPLLVEDNRTINRNNTGLEPWTADNYDISLETYSLKGATIALSLFRKDISGFFVTRRTDATVELLAEMGLSDEYLDYDVVTRTNSVNSVALSGLEWSWRQSLKPFAALPKWTRNIQVWANGTHLRISGAGKDEFSGYSPRIINWGASFASAKFLFKYNVSRIGRQRARLLGVSATVPAGTYDAQDTRMVQDGSIEYRFHRKLAIYASVRNLAYEPRPLITYSPSIPEYAYPRAYNFYGALWTIGVKGTF